MNIFSKKYSPIALLMLLSLMTAACGGDDNGGGDGGTDSNNANANTTEKGIVAQGLEMPRVQKGNNYLLLSKYDDNGNLNYSVEWDCMNRAQRWTCWVWTKSNSNKNWDRSKWESGETFNGFGGTGDPFQPDKEVDANYRSELSHYSSSGYNRGHICASEDRIYSKTANGQTFYLTNMHPQIYDFNNYVWKNMEIKVRNWRDATVNAGGTMYICKGGTIGDVVLNGKTQSGVIERRSGSSKYEINSTSGIPVPKYFFMAVLKYTSGGTYSAMAFWAEHKYDHSTNLSPYMISIDELEARTGYDFFCNLPDKLENSVESIQPQISEWK